MNGPELRHFTLDPNVVAQPAQHVVTIASQVVGTCLRALANDDLSPPEMRADFRGYKFIGPEMSDEERRATYQNWILSKGFQDLARGVRETLEEAAFYLEMFKAGSRRTTWGEFVAIRDRIASFKFPKLLKAVNAGLTQPLAFEAEFGSLQNVRNCLEHRGGRVGLRDVDPATGIMTLTFPRLRIFYRRGNDEIELASGVGLDTYTVDDPSAEEGGVPIYITRVTRSREYALGEPVAITEFDFYEIAMACHIFASEVAAKLPRLPSIGSDTPTEPDAGPPS